MVKNKKPLVKIGLVFIGLLLFLTFFSNTIFDFNLTNVAVDFPRDGVLSRVADGTGIVQFMETDRYFAQASGRITLHVTEGDTVSAYDLLFTIDGDTENLQRILDGLLAEKERISLRIDRATDNLERTHVELRRSSGNQRRAIEATIADIEFQIKELELDLRVSQSEVERLREEITGKEEISVLSERDGKVLSIFAVSGTTVNENAIIMEIGVPEIGFKSIVMLPENVDFLSVGDEVVFDIRARNMFGVTGEINNITFENGQLRTEVHFHEENLTGGEGLALRVQYISEQHDLLVPNRALRSDRSGDYVLVAEMVSGRLRNEFYARRMQVLVISRDNLNTAVVMLTDDRLPIIIDSDRMVSADDRIRIVGGSDLIGIR